MKFILPVLLMIFGYMPVMASSVEELDSNLERFIAETKLCSSDDDFDECVEKKKSEIDSLMEGVKEEKIRNNASAVIPDDFDFTYPLPDEEFFDTVFSLDWKISETETIKHISANAEIPTINYDEYYLDNKADILQYLYWVEGILFDVNDYEVYQEFDFITIMYSEFNNEGYVKLDDWKNIDLDDFLEEKREMVFAANANRREQGLDTVKSVQWLLEPELDDVNNMVHYVFTLGWSDGVSTSNGTSLILGRNGYTTVDSVYNVDDDNIMATINLVKTKLSDYKFNNDYQYSDYKSGDKIAAVGIAALVAASFGVKGAASAATFGKVLVKFWWLLLAPFLFIGRLFRKK